MKKLITLGLSLILVMSMTMPVRASEREGGIFKKDLSVCKDGEMSVYRQNIREFINGQWKECECWGLCSCAQAYHVLESTKQEDFYSAFFNGEYCASPIGNIYQDCSSSMEETFRYEKSKIIKNLSSFFNEKDEIEVFKDTSTNLYGLLGSFKKEVIEEIEEVTITSPGEVPVIITDLWDTEGKEEELLVYNGEIIFCVPYASTNKEGVLHCENVINNLFKNYTWIPGSMSIYVVFTDEVIVHYNNGYLNGSYDFIEIYIP